MSKTRKVLVEFPIKNLKQRDSTFCKRRKNIMKKLMELSRLCDVNIYMTIFNKDKQSIFEYCSSKEFNVDVV